MKKLGLALSLLAATAVAAFADAADDHEAIMKERAGLLRQLSPIAKGEAPFDQAAAQALLVKLDANARGTSVDALVPNVETAATISPRIADDINGYKAAWAKYEADTGAAVAAAPKDQAALAAAFGTIAANCSSCHQSFRVRD